MNRTQLQYNQPQYNQPQSANKLQSANKTKTQQNKTPTQFDNDKLLNQPMDLRPMF